ncbi:50S ribosomal protein L3 [Candidatus Uhrbacteria bacterium]|nr:50S ribosomal protein L3 [Candidatus Uhrbacteria bacterium]
MKFILGRKMEMTQRFGSDGRVIPVTLVEAGPCVVTRVKQPEVDGYQAVQLGFGKAKKATKPVAGQLKGLGPFRFLREFRAADVSSLTPGVSLDVSLFSPGDKIQIIGTSKGRGFQGVVKRHHFSGSPASHGHKDQLRMPGSIGSKRQGPVQKGKRMAGRMGGERVTVKNLEIVEVDAAKNLLALKGAVPGARGSLVLIQSV